MATFFEVPDGAAGEPGPYGKFVLRPIEEAPRGAALAGCQDLRVGHLHTENVNHIG